MKKLTRSLGTVILVLSSFKAVSAQASTLQEYCREITSLQGRKARIQSLIQSYDQPGLMSVPNQYRTDKNFEGGYFDLGLCWWKSRFQRSMLYLARLSPEKPRPTRAEALQIIRTVVKMESPVEIPGYDTVYAFTEAYKKEIIESLESWQRKDTVKGAVRTLNPLRPTFYRKTSSLFQQAQIAETMLKEHGAIPYALLQYKGIYAHSWLILQVTPLYDEVVLDYRPPYPPKTKKLLKGYRLIVENPNDAIYFTDVFRDTQQITGIYGLFDKYKLNNYIGEEEPFPFYIDWLRDLEDLNHAIQKTCKRSPQPTLLPDMAPWGTYQ
jgi:hypothetical protein